MRPQAHSRRGEEKMTQAQRARIQAKIDRYKKALSDQRARFGFIDDSQGLRYEIPEFRRQLFGSAQPLMLASGVLLALAAFPGLPKIPFLLLGGLVGSSAWRMRRKSVTAEKLSQAQPPPQRGKPRVAAAG